jgi:hypothetical protein
MGTAGIEKVTEAYGVGRERILYVIRNARLDPQWASVERSIFDISGLSKDGYPWGKYSPGYVPVN